MDKAVIDTQGFRFADLKSYRDVNFLPGVVKYGDLPGLLALSAPLPLWITGESNAAASADLGVTNSAYAAAEGTTNSTWSSDEIDAAVPWLLE